MEPELAAAIAVLQNHHQGTESSNFMEGYAALGEALAGEIMLGDIRSLVKHVNCSSLCTNTAGLHKSCKMLASAVAMLCNKPPSELNPTLLLTHLNANAHAGGTVESVVDKWVSETLLPAIIKHLGTCFGHTDVAISQGLEMRQLQTISRCISCVLQEQASSRCKDEVRKLIVSLREIFHRELYREVKHLLKELPCYTVDNQLANLMDASVDANVPAFEVLQATVQGILRPVAKALSTRAGNAASTTGTNRQRLLARLQPALDGLDQNVAQLEQEVIQAHSLLGQINRPGTDHGANSPLSDDLLPVPQFLQRVHVAAERHAPLPCELPQASMSAQSLQLSNLLTSVTTVPNSRCEVVLNCANIGFSYAESARKFGWEVSGQFEWEGVRRVFRYYKGFGITPQGVCKNRTAALHGVPDDLKPHIIVCPVIHTVKDLDDLATIKLAMKYGCQFVDNDNYRDWKKGEGKRVEEEVRCWLQQGEGTKLKVAYIFDRTGSFVPCQPPR